MAKEFVGQEYMAATNGKGLHEQNAFARFFSRLTITATIGITVVSLAIIAFCCFFNMCPIIGTSMMTTLNASGNNTDNAITCTLGTPKHGDIVVYKLYLKNTRYYQYLIDAQNGSETAQWMINELKETYNRIDEGGNYMYIIKRLIALPGDTISMRRIGSNYEIYLNGEKLNEDYLDPLVAKPDAMNYVQLWNVLNDRSYADMNDWITVPWEVCAQINNTEKPTDGSIVSKYMLKIPEGYTFLMGDNRGSADTEFNHSWDSTYLGPLPETSYVSLCVDVINNEVNLPEYLWNKFVYYVCFGWVWQK